MEYQVIRKIKQVANVVTINVNLLVPRRFLLAPFLAFSIFCAIFTNLIVFSSSVHAETLDYNVNVEPALNVTIPTDTISLLLDPTNQTFFSQELNISVGTNNPYGYRLTMSSTGTSLVHTEDSNYTIPTLPTLAGGYTDESFIVDKWGYKQDSSSWNSYTSGTTILESYTPVNNDNTNLSFGAKIDYAQAPGNYTLVLNFNAVAKVATNDLTFTFAGEGVEAVKVCTVAGDCTGDNLIGTVTTSGSSVPGLEDGSTYYLYPTFTTNHEFVSWEKTSEAGSISATDVLNPTFTMTDEPASVTVTGKTKLYMQDMVASQCTTTAQTVYDKRDGQAYLVQQLADGKCWLLDNLRLGSATFADGVTTLDSTNTNTTTKSIPTTTFAGWNTTSGFSSYNTPMINTASVDVVPTPTYGSASNKVGVYYNYCAATMQSYCYNSSSGTGNASEDVCPKGWRMPTGGSSGEYQNLCNKVKGSTCSYSDTSTAALQLRNVLSTPLSGYFDDSSASNQGSGGYFWSSTYYNGSAMYSLVVNSSYVRPQYGNNRHYGFSVRCVLETRTIADVVYMQDVTPAMLANTAEGATATLIDKRDNQSYLVGKLADGKLWMLDNLRLGSADLVEALSTSNTNMSSSVAFTLPASSSSDFTSYTAPMINTDSVNTVPTPTYGSASNKVGVYYNYCAASAGTYCMASGSGSGNASYDICPKGWRMPTGGSSGEYQNLCNKVKGSTCSNDDTSTAALQLRNVLSTPLSGRFLNSSAGNQGSDGNFWSSTNSDGGNMYYLRVRSSNVTPQSSYYRDRGFSVRCVLK